MGNDLDPVSRCYDYISVGSIIILELVTAAFFAVDYVFRLVTARFLYPNMKESHAIRKYIFSFDGIVDLLAFLSYCLPFFFPMGSVAFRMLRIVKIFRLFRMNAFYKNKYF